MLTLRNVSKSFGSGAIAVSDVSLSIGPGMFGLLGPNGAGKSTLMRMIATLIQPDSGDIYFNSRDISCHPLETRAALGYLPQDYGFYPTFTPVEILDYLSALRGSRSGVQRAYARDLLERVNLTSVAHCKVGTFSHGMRQRLGIAQALLGQPQLLIVDEPTAGLDPEERLRLHDLLAEVGQGIVVLLSTHIVSDVAVLCPRFAILHNGRVLVDTTPRDATSSLDGHIYEGVVPSRQVASVQEEATILSRLTVSANEVRLKIHTRTVPPPGFAPAPCSLEDAYFALVGRAAGRS